jgi:hypothetical protein
MSLVATAMQPLIEKYERERLDKNEILFSRYGAHDLFMAMNSQSQAILSEANRRNAENSYGNVAKVPVIEGDAVVIGDTRSCSIADAENTSALIELSFTPFVWGFTMYPGQYVTGPQAMNYVGYDADLATKADKCTLALMTAVDTAARNKIETNINTYFPAAITTGYYPVVGDALQVTQAQKNDFFNQLQAIMQEFDFYNTTHILGSTSLTPMVSRLSNQRTGNATNESFQFNLGDFEFHKSNRITNGAGVQATIYAIQEGNLAIVNRNNPNARAGFKIGGGDTPEIQWGTMMYPKLGMEVGTFYKAECAASAGAVTDAATLKESYGFDTEICWLTPYNSDPATKQTPIIKAEISAT